MSAEERESFLRGLGCPRCHPRTYPEETEEDIAVARIIEVLNDITEQCQILDREMRHAKKRGLLPADEAYHDLDIFFFRCQVVEDRIKTAQEQGFINPVQRLQLEKELKNAVERMIDIAKRSRLYQQVMRELSATRGIETIKRTLSSPAPRG